MAASPKWKVFDSLGEYVAAVKYPEHAAMLVAVLGRGSEVRVGHSKRFTVWIEGTDGDAGESYDATAQVLYHNLTKMANAARAKTEAAIRRASENGAT